ncbi:MAG: hypothetical protein C5B58_02465 [Acidobacteria bacterium]|nr:MAG: hypothetical protein C5B58_02465 [Acidobacteriota bacterium]
MSERMRFKWHALMVCLLWLVTSSRARAGDGQDLDVYKWRMTGVWWFSSPTGSFTGKANSGTFDLSRDFGFSRYSTFTGSADWKFRRKHHLLFSVSPVTNSRRATLNRAVEFQGITYDVGASVTADIKALAFAPGYQYDIIRRNRISFSIAAQLYLMNTSADLTGTAILNGQSSTRAASGSILAPLPVLGPRVRWYPLHSGRLAVEGAFQGMSFFGYGYFMAARGTANVALSRHWRLNFGYQMGTRLKINDSRNRIGVRLTQKGPIAGFEASW